jgi:hypothetical protein
VKQGQTRLEWLYKDVDDSRVTCIAANQPMRISLSDFNIGNSTGCAVDVVFNPRDQERYVATLASSGSQCFVRLERITSVDGEKSGSKKSLSDKCRAADQADNLKEPSTCRSDRPHVEGRLVDISQVTKARGPGRAVGFRPAHLRNSAKALTSLAPNTGRVTQLALRRWPLSDQCRERCWLSIPLSAPNVHEMSQGVHSLH